MVGLLDMVKVLSFALSEGKVAVHCHAGLGRTGKLNISIYSILRFWFFFFQNSPREYTPPMNMKCKKNDLFLTFVNKSTNKFNK